ncbi:RNA ligase-domain-containing protein [Xylariales sp. AK1849]|nr:RNA ligase-domain-containing protein [Xylariales sp. AK1849]
MAPPTRKLVSLRRISKLEPISGTRMTVASIDGWNVVVSMYDVNVGDIVVYFEIDCFLPSSTDRFWEYCTPDRITKFEGQEGYLVRTFMVRGHISQGLVYPLNQLPEVEKYAKMKMKNMGYNDNAIDVNWVNTIGFQLDYSTVLGVKKFEENFVDSALGFGRAPIFFPQPGCERAQNIVALFEKYGDTKFQITEKLDGVPMTVYKVKRSSQWFNALPRTRGIWTAHGRPTYGVCSRHEDYEDTQDSLFWKAARDQGIIGKLGMIERELFPRNLREHGYGADSGSRPNFAIQGELCGHAIASNSMGFEEGKHYFYVFGIYDIDRQRWVPRNETLRVCQKLEIDHVPVIGRMKLKNFATNYDNLLKKAEGKGGMGKNREGLVFRTMDNSLAFKVIANSWLLEYGKNKETPDQW